MDDQDQKAKAAAAASPVKEKATPPSAYRYKGPSAGAKGKALNYPGHKAFKPIDMTEAQIAAMESAHPGLFSKLWEKVS